MTTNPAAGPLIEGHGLHRTFDDGRVEALRGIDIRIEAGEFVAIQGPSGCGKSTLLHVLGLLDRPTRGDVRFHGASVDALGDLSAIRARHIGFVFQASYLLPTLTALENVQVPMFEMPWSASERRRRGRALLDAAGLATRANHRPSRLSGGERQRVAIARSLANDPELLLADEPTGSLDSTNAARILDMLTALRTGRRLALVVVTHDPAVASRADRIVQMIDGTVEPERWPQSAAV